MNAPILQRQQTGRQSATLRLFAVFHLNLAFSAIEEEQRGDVIERCYWPLLELAAEHGPIGIEATGFTLEEIVARDPAWIEEAARLIGAGQVEFIGSGYAQMIGPLVPARVTEANLRIGNKIHEGLLGQTPALALVNEQAYSAGLVGLYRDAGYRAILMDWDNPAAHHPEWAGETRFLPQRVRGADAREIALLWTNTVAFQKLQRFAHGDIDLDEYVRHVVAQRAETPRAYCLYASDAEIFDFRPGRYRTEEMSGGDSEWLRIGEALSRLRDLEGLKLSAPSDALGLDDVRQRPPLQLESAACPVPVKKQRKYNLSRWAVTGRDDLGINAACERIYTHLVEAEITQAPAWKELCYLWSSDFRTHITDARWNAYCARLKKAEARWAKFDGHSINDCHPRPSAEREGKGTQDMTLTDSVRTHFDANPPTSILKHAPGSPSPRGADRAARPGMTLDLRAKPYSRHIAIETPTLSVSLDRRRGLAISALQFAGDEKPLIGGLPHGHFDAIDLQADWYTGDCVFEAPGEHKVTDLEWCEPHIEKAENGDSIVRADIETPRGIIRKEMRFSATRPSVDFDLTFVWNNWDRGVLRLGHVTLLPDAFDWNTLSLTTHNGGKEAETFWLKDQTVDHGAPVSFLVSSSFGLGMTEGWAELGDSERTVRVSIERQIAPLLGLLTHRRVGGSLFCQLALSALELDETRKPSPYRSGPRRFRFSISRGASSVHC